MSLLKELNERREAVANKLEDAFLLTETLRAELDDLDTAIAALELSPLSLFGDPKWTQEELANINAQGHDPISPNLLEQPMTDTPDDLVKRLREMTDNFVEFSQTSTNDLHRRLYFDRADVSRKAIERIEALESHQRVLREALETIRDRHIPDQPMADDCDEAEYARSQHTALRVIALRALAGDAP